MAGTKGKSGLKPLRYALWALVVLALAGLGWFQFVSPRSGSGTGSIADAGTAALGRGDYRLVATDGTEFSQAALKGQPSAVFFGFTHCPDVCPTTLAYIANVLDRLSGEVERVAPIFITVDPSRDTPEVMAEYVQAFHPKLVGLTGSEAAVAAAAQSFRVYYERMEEETAPDGYLMAHSGHIYLMTPEGRFEDVFREADQSAEDMAVDVLARMNGK